MRAFANRELSGVIASYADDLTDDLTFGVITALLGIGLVLFGAAPLEPDGSRHIGTLNWVAAGLCVSINVSTIEIYTRARHVAPPDLPVHVPRFRRPS